MAWPMLPFANPVTAVIDFTAAAISGRATTTAVRVPGNPSFERLNERMTFSSQIGMASRNRIPGHGVP